MASMNVKKGDNVMVIAGKDKGKAGKVLAVKPAIGRVYIEGINIVSKSKKPRNAQDQGGILKQEGSIDCSNVMHICGECGGVVRVRHTSEVAKNGKTVSVRVCAKCGASLDAKKSSAKKAAKKATATKKKTTKAEAKGETTAVKAEETEVKSDEQKD